MPYNPQGSGAYGAKLARTERALAHDARQERKAERKAIREAERAERIAAGIHGAPIDYDAMAGATHG
jgi:hypothetical protein